MMGSRLEPRWCHPVIADLENMTMTKILEECEVSLQTLGTLLDDAGISADATDGKSLVLESPAGLKFRIHQDEVRKFLALRTYLPVRKDLDDRFELANRMNSEVFLACFHVDGDGDIGVEYDVSYERGLIAPQFLRLVRRYCGMLDHVLHRFGAEEVFAFGAPAEMPGPARPAVLQ
jgi:hypothetical protein